MKPLWFVEKDAFGWTINCRFMLNGKKAGVAHLISSFNLDNEVDKSGYIADTIQYLTDRRDNFIAEDAA